MTERVGPWVVWRLNVLRRRDRMHVLALARRGPGVAIETRHWLYPGPPLTADEVETLVLLANTFGLEVMSGTLQGWRPDETREP